MSFIAIDLFVTLPVSSVVQTLVYRGIAKIIFSDGISSVVRNLFKLNSTQLYPAVVPGFWLEAPYGILNIDRTTITYKQLKVKYNVKKVIKDINELSFPGYKHVLKIFYGIDWHNCWLSCNKML